MRLTDDYAAAQAEVEPGQYVLIAVTDTGSGMAPELADRAFNPFFTSKGDEALGLGLSVVHGFIKQSGGYVEIASGAEAKAGAGTEVNIYLRRLRESPRAEEAAREATT